MSFKKSLGKSFVLLVIILILLAGGLLWFDHLGVVHIKSVFAPAYKILKKSPQTSTTATQSKPLVSNLDEDRLRKQREALDIFKEELDKLLNQVLGEDLESLAEKRVSESFYNKEIMLQRIENIFALKDHAALSDFEQNYKKQISHYNFFRPLINYCFTSYFERVKEESAAFPFDNILLNNK